MDILQDQLTGVVTGHVDNITTQIRSIAEAQNSLLVALTTIHNAFTVLDAKATTLYTDTAKAHVFTDVRRRLERSLSHFQTLVQRMQTLQLEAHRAKHFEEEALNDVVLQMKAACDIQIPNFKALLKGDSAKVTAESKAGEEESEENPDLSTPQQ